MQALTLHRRIFDSSNLLESNFVPLSPSGARLRGLALVPRNTAPPVTAARDGPDNLFGPFGFLKAGQVRNGVQFLIKGAGRKILFPRCSWVSILAVVGCFLKDLGRVLKHLGPILDDLWPALVDFGPVLGDLGPVLENLGPILEDKS